MRGPRWRSQARQAAAGVSDSVGGCISSKKRWKSLTRAPARPQADGKQTCQALSFPLATPQDLQGKEGFGCIAGREDHGIAPGILAILGFAHRPEWEVELEKDHDSLAATGQRPLAQVPQAPLACSPLLQQLQQLQ